MGTTIILGKAGRLVVPKSIREKLGLGEGSRLLLEIAGVKRFYTLNLDDFLAFHRPGDPEVLAP